MERTTIMVMVITTNRTKGCSLVLPDMLPVQDIILHTGLTPLQGTLPNMDIPHTDILMVAGILLRADILQLDTHRQGTHQQGTPQQDTLPNTDILLNTDIQVTMVHLIQVS